MTDHAPPLADPDAPADWYPDPESNDLLRWWDGESWSDDVRPTDDSLAPDWHPVTLVERYGPGRWFSAIERRVVTMLSRPRD